MEKNEVGNEMEKERREISPPLIRVIHTVWETPHDTRKEKAIDRLERERNAFSFSGAKTI